MGIWDGIVPSGPWAMHPELWSSVVAARGTPRGCLQGLAMPWMRPWKWGRPTAMRRCIPEMWAHLLCRNHPLFLLAFGTGSRAGEAARNPKRPIPALQRESSPSKGTSPNRGFLLATTPMCRVLLHRASSPSRRLQAGMLAAPRGLQLRNPVLVWAGTKRTDAQVLGSCGAPVSTAPSCAFRKLVRNTL